MSQLVISTRSVSPAPSNSSTPEGATSTTSQSSQVHNSTAIFRSSSMESKVSTQSSSRRQSKAHLIAASQQEKKKRRKQSSSSSGKDVDGTVEEPRMQWTRGSVLTRHFAVALVQELENVDVVAPAFSSLLPQCLRNKEGRKVVKRQPSLTTPTTENLEQQQQQQQPAATGSVRFITPRKSDTFRASDNAQESAAAKSANFKKALFGKSAGTAAVSSSSVLKKRQSTVMIQDSTTSPSSSSRPPPLMGFAPSLLASPSSTSHSNKQGDQPQALPTILPTDGSMTMENSISFTLNKTTTGISPSNSNSDRPLNFSHSNIAMVQSMTTFERKKSLPAPMEPSHLGDQLAKLNEVLDEDKEHEEMQKDAMGQNSALKRKASSKRRQNPDGRSHAEVAAHEQSLPVMQTEYPPDRALMVDDFVLCMLLRLHQLKVISFTVPKKWTFDPCSDMDAEDFSMEMIIKERIARWVNTCTDEWLSHSPQSVGGELDYFSDLIVLRYCLIDLFMNIDYLRDGCISWLQFVTYLADSSSMSAVQRSVTQVQLLMEPDRATHKELTRMQKIKNWGSRGIAVTLTVSRNGTETIKVLDTSNFSAQKTYLVGAKHGKVICMEVIPRYDLIACAFFDGIRLYDADNWLCKAFFREEDPVTIMRYVPTIKKLVSGTRNGGMRLYQVSNVDKMFYSKNTTFEDPTFEERWHHTEAITDILPSTPTNSLVSSAMDGTIVFSHVESNTVRRLHGCVSLGMVLVDIHGIIFSYGVELAPMVWVYNVPSAKPITLGGKGTTPHIDRIIGVSLLNDRNYTVSMDRKGGVKVWDMWELTCVQTLNVTEGDIGGEFLVFHDFYYTEKDRKLVTAAKDRTFQLDYNDKDEKKNILQASFDPISSILYLETSAILITISETTLCFWNLVNLRPLYTFENVVGDVITCAVANEPTRQLFVGTKTGKVHTLSLGNGTIRKTFDHPAKKPVRSMVYIKEVDMLMACAGGHAIAVTQFDIKEFMSSTTTTLEVSALAYHASEKLLLIGEDSGAVSVWRLSMGVSIRWDRVAKCEPGPDGGSILGIVACTKTSSFFIYDTVGMIHMWDIDRFKKEYVVDRTTKAGKKTARKRSVSLTASPIRNRGDPIGGGQTSPQAAAVGGKQKKKANPNLDASNRVDEDDEVVRARLVTRWAHRRRHSAYATTMVSCKLMEDPYQFLYVVDELGYGTVYDIRNILGERMKIPTAIDPADITITDLMHLAEVERAKKAMKQPKNDVSPAGLADVDSGLHSRVGSRPNSREQLGDFLAGRSPKHGDSNSTHNSPTNFVGGPSIVDDQPFAAMTEADLRLKAPSVPTVTSPPINTPLEVLTLLEKSGDASFEPLSSNSATPITSSVTPPTLRSTGTTPQSVGLSSLKKPNNHANSGLRATGRFMVEFTYRDPSSIAVYNITANKVHQDSCSDLQILPNCPQCIVTSSRDGHVKFWSLYLNSCAGSLSLGDVNAKPNQLYGPPPGFGLDATAVSTPNLSRLASAMGSFANDPDSNPALSGLNLNELRPLPDALTSPADTTMSLNTSAKGTTSPPPPALQPHEQFMVVTGPSSLDDVPYPYNPSERARMITETHLAKLQDWQVEDMEPILCSDVLVLPSAFVKSSTEESDVPLESSFDDDTDDDGDAVNDRKMMGGATVAFVGEELLSGEEGHLHASRRNVDEDDGFISNTFSFKKLDPTVADFGNGSNDQKDTLPIAKSEQSLPSFDEDTGGTFLTGISAELPDAPTAPPSPTNKKKTSRKSSFKKKPKKRTTAASIGLSHEEQVVIYRDWAYKQQEILHRRRGGTGDADDGGDNPGAVGNDLIYQTVQMRNKAKQEALQGTAKKQRLKKDLLTDTRSADKKPVILSFVKDRQLLYKLHTSDVNEVVEELLNNPAQSTFQMGGNVRAVGGEETGLGANARDRAKKKLAQKERAEKQAAEENSKLTVRKKKSSTSQPSATKRNTSPTRNDLGEKNSDELAPGSINFHKQHHGEDDHFNQEKIKGVSELVVTDPHKLAKPTEEEQLLDKIQRNKGDQSVMTMASEVSPFDTSHTTNTKYPPQIQATLRKLENRALCVKARHDYKDRWQKERKMDPDQLKARAETLEHMPKEQYMAKIAKLSRAAEDGRGDLLPTRVVQHDKRTLWRRPEERAPLPKFERTVGGANTTAKVPKYVTDSTSKGATSQSADTNIRRSKLQSLHQQGDDGTQHNIEMVRRVKLLAPVGGGGGGTPPPDAGNGEAKQPALLPRARSSLR